MAARARADAERVADRLHSAAIHLLRQVRREDVTTGLSAARLSALSVVVFGNMPTLGQLAEAEQVSPATISRVVAGLEADGLVRRVPVAGDARSYRLRPTPKGTRVMHQGRRRRVRRLAAGLAELPPEDLATLAAAVDVLDRVLGRG
ncbi:MAG TPA: MarR family transcriptional regulator [Mycobacteriales bacterium]|jgi:DNA-binding MarR family transcriptional regulator|nr:MarR family transcriptional regulator [Mycobacteriales bacterium]